MYALCVSIALPIIFFLANLPKYLTVVGRGGGGKLHSWWHNLGSCPKNGKNGPTIWMARRSLFGLENTIHSIVGSARAEKALNLIQ